MWKYTYPAASLKSNTFGTILIERKDNVETVIIRLNMVFALRTNFPATSIKGLDFYIHGDTIY